jgi:hypothetical protein
MKKALVVATAAALVGGSVLVYSAFAQQGPSPTRWRPSAEDVSAFANARIAALKAGLALTSEQEKLWPAVESALQELAKNRRERVEKFRAARETQTGTADPVARLRRGAEYFGQRANEMTKLADAVQPLYEKLDDAQKRRFHILSRMNQRGHFMRSRHRTDDERGWRRRSDDWRGHRFGWRDNEDPRGPGMHRRFGWRDDEGPDRQFMHRFGRRSDDALRGPHADDTERRL